MVPLSLLRRARRSPRLGLALAGAMALTLLPAAAADATQASDRRHDDSEVVVANRASGDISIIDTDSLEVETIDLPGEAEPMYVSHDPVHDRILVGDRASDTVVALDEQTHDVVGTIDVGAGVFHQWVDARRRQLWVVGDTSDTISVIDTDSLVVIATIDLPPDLADQGGSPHDVFVAGRHAFVSVVGLDGAGAVVQFSTRTFTETGRIETGGDPHVFVSRRQLYVASQDGSSVSRYRARDLRPLSSFDVAAAHGLFVTPKGEVLVTNIAGGGTEAVHLLDRRLRAEIDVTDTGVPTPHNLTVDDRRQVYVTHSGPTANQVSVIGLGRHGFGEPSTVTVGTNPFGLAFVD